MPDHEPTSVASSAVHMAGGERKTLMNNDVHDIERSDVEVTDARPDWHSLVPYIAVEQHGTPLLRFDAQRGSSRLCKVVVHWQDKRERGG